MKKINYLFLTAIAVIAFSCSSKTNADAIVGKWVRPDGGYVLEINEITDNNNLKAKYLNPQSIKISKSTYEVEKGEVKIHIAFNDENYYGSKYNLTYHAGKDILMGAYYQATMGETYQVIFTRQ